MQNWNDQTQIGSGSALFDEGANCQEAGQFATISFLRQKGTGTSLMAIDVAPEETLRLRDLDRHEMNCQIVLDSWHECWKLKVPPPRQEEFPSIATSRTATCSWRSPNLSGVAGSAAT